MALLPFPCIYDVGYNLNLGDHVFPAVKFERIAARLESEGLTAAANLLSPKPAARADVELVHTPGWTAALMDGTIRYDEVTRLEIPYSRPMADAFLLHTAGSILAAKEALANGAAFNIGGGFHHAFPGHGEGFCALHDVAVALRVCQRDTQIRRAMVIDTDVHHGNGTAAIFADDSSVFTMSIHQWNNYPSEKPPSDLDIHMDDGAGDEEYLSALDAGLQECFSRFQPDLVAYIAGSDPYREDKLGGLSVSMEGMAKRDALVFQRVRSQRVPCFVTLAGGYARDVDDTIALHINTARQLAAAMTRPPAAAPSR